MNAAIVSFAEVKRAVRIEAVLARYGLLGTLALKGANFTGRCPFCAGASERAFRVSPEKNAWYCFGCKEGGNVLDFVAKREGMTLRQAAIALNDWFELGLQAPSEPAKPTAEPPAAAPDTEPTANQPLTFALKTLDPSHLAVAGLGLSPTTVGDFGLGFCSKGVLKGRVAIPIHSRAGELLAYAGLSPDLPAAERYLFPAKFRPALELFNIDRVVSIEDDGPTYLASEILDAIRLADAGVGPVLGLFDGTLSDAQLGLLGQIVAAGSRLVLAGSSFEPRAVARLSEHYFVRTLGFDELMPASSVSTATAE